MTSFLPSIAPEKLIRALSLLVPASIRSERYFHFIGAHNYFSPTVPRT